MKYTLYPYKVLSIIVMCNALIYAAPTPYIPSYDDLYEEDMRQARGDRNYFEEPEDALNYADYHYVGAHAAEKYPRFFPEYSLQEQPIPGLLATGVRGLMISIYNWSLSWSSMIKEGISIVCSHPTIESKVFRKNGKPLYQTLHYEMNRIFNFLKSNPKAVITIVFEDFADTANLSRDMKEIIMKNNYDPLLKPADWPSAQEKGEWPTLGWMRKNNKRLVMFTETFEQMTDFTWPVKNYFWENVFGTVDPDLICVAEKDSIVEGRKGTRALVSFGCYGSVAYVPDALGSRDSTYCFSYDTAKGLTLGCQKKNFAGGKLFNAYWADHIIDAARALTRQNKKTVFQYVNELNVVKKK
jgi:hypothetical protein